MLLTRKFQASNGSMTSHGLSISITISFSHVLCVDGEGGWGGGGGGGNLTWPSKTGSCSKTCHWLYHNPVLLCPPSFAIVNMHSLSEGFIWRETPHPLRGGGGGNADLELRGQQWLRDQPWAGHQHPCHPHQHQPSCPCDPKPPLPHLCWALRLYCLARP